MRLASFIALALSGVCGVARAEPTIAIETSMGTITVDLDRAHAPRTVDNFLRYASEGHYDGTLVYRVAPGFVVQAGSFDSPTHARPVHDPIPLEAGNGLSNVRGTIAMARQADPNSGTAEFFINLADNMRLDRQPGDAEGSTGYAVFGRVTSGMDVVDRIAAVPIGAGGPMPYVWPQTPVTIEKVSILASAPTRAPARAAPR
jgi:peptidyl-prolyl cis-trans isomerase A (cyclophilin A)/peptidyl-prolyl cis-trans isomerase B (cyclophilin B)